MSCDEQQPFWTLATMPEVLVHIIKFRERQSKWPFERSNGTVPQSADHSSHRGALPIMLV